MYEVKNPPMSVKDKLLRKKLRKQKVEKPEPPVTTLMKSTTNMNYNDLKRACISRGMPFKDVLEGDFLRLQNWFYYNREIKPIKSLINKYDDWLDDELEKSGNGHLVHPQLRLGYVGRENDNKLTKKAKPEKKKKKVRTKTSDGIYKGTKKALTFELQKEGLDLKTVTKKVLKQFPDGSEKSIKIWFNKARALHKGK
jgi:hypothetical protein